MGFALYGGEILGLDLLLAAPQRSAKSQGICELKGASPGHPTSAAWGPGGPMLVLVHPAWDPENPAESCPAFPKDPESHRLPLPEPTSVTVWLMVGTLFCVLF